MELCAGCVAPPIQEMRSPVAWRHCTMALLNMWPCGFHVLIVRYGLRASRGQSTPEALGGACVGVVWSLASGPASSSIVVL